MFVGVEDCNVLAFAHNLLWALDIVEVKILNYYAYVVTWAPTTRS